jgi:hypothetical protein
MHEAMWHWWAGHRRARNEHSCGPGGGWGGPGGPSGRHGHPGDRHGHPGDRHGPGPGGGGGDDDFGGGAFGVRRPLKFLAWKLELEESQFSELAKILDDLKTERAQAAVDTRRSTSAFADAFGKEAFEADKAQGAADLRVKSAERLRDAVVTALTRIHAMLDGEQRERFAYLIRTGVISI